MNKKFLLSGFVVTAGFLALTAFGGQTLEQQKQEIAAAITTQLDEFRAQKQQECTDRVNAEAQRRYDEYVASLPPVKATKPGSKSAAKKSPATAKAPLPQAVPTDPQKQRGGAVQEGKVEEQKKREGAMPPGDVESQKKRGGASKEGGGK
ncbi:MAG: hypothetical protein IPM98_05470 [Lewinellaceae bacterium]|nr:hypothetical protein [Lewinellaceae bacterium]